MSYADQGTAAVRRQVIVGGPTDMRAVLDVASALTFVKLLAAVAAAGIALGYAGHLVLGPPKR